MTSETNRKQKENGETEQRSAKWSALSSGRGIQNAFVVIVSVLCLYSQIVRQKRKQLCNSQADRSERRTKGGGGGAVWYTGVEEEARGRGQNGWMDGAGWHVSLSFMEARLRAAALVGIEIPYSRFGGKMRLSGKAGKKSDTSVRMRLLGRNAFPWEEEEDGRHGKSASSFITEFD